MTEKQIAETSMHLIEVPLQRPYPLSFRTVEHLDMVLVRVVDHHGAVGIGECCPLPPYSVESVDDVWTWLSHRLPRTLGKPAADVITAADDGRSHRESAFSSVALTSACESLVDPIDSSTPRRVPVVGIVLGTSTEAVLDDVETLVSSGYQTLKMKVGFDPAEDAEKVTRVLKRIPTDAKVRVDANAGWDFHQATTFAAALDDDSIELLEQPFPRERWDWVEQFCRDNPHVAVMLDESIDGASSIRRAANAGARLVKFKLVKAGTRRRLRELRSTAESLGLNVVVGNGTAGVIDNWYEAHCIDPDGRAGEMNGALKVVDPIVTQRPQLDRGHLSFPAGFTTDVSAAELSDRSIRELVFR